MENILDYNSFFNNVIIFSSITLGLFGTFVASIFSMKEDKLIKFIFVSVSYRKQLRWFLYILTVISVLLILLSILIVSININYIHGNWKVLYEFLRYFSIFLFIVHIVTILIFFITSIRAFTK